MGRLGSVGVKTSFSFTHFDSVMDGSVPAASRLCVNMPVLTSEDKALRFYELKRVGLLIA